MTHAFTITHASTSSGTVLYVVQVSDVTPTLAELAREVAEITRSTQDWRALQRWLAARPVPPLPPRFIEGLSRRHGFQQMARLPCYRGVRTR